MAMNPEYRGTASGIAAKKKTAMNKTVATPGTKVSQATINKIKSMGMSAALKSAPKANAEMTEALRRMYGQRRLDAATKSKSSVPAQKARAKARAKAAGRPYPNLIDNAGARKKK